MVSRRTCCHRPNIRNGEKKFICVSFCRFVGFWSSYERGERGQDPKNTKPKSKNKNKAKPTAIPLDLILVCTMNRYSKYSKNVLSASVWVRVCAAVFF